MQVYQASKLTDQVSATVSRVSGHIEEMLTVTVYYDALKVERLGVVPISPCDKLIIYSRTFHLACQGVCK